MAEAVTQKDFELFKQEIKHEFSLFLERTDSKTADMINKRVDRVGKIVIALFTVFVLAFAGYFEYMRTTMDRVNEDRVGRLEKALLASMEFNTPVKQKTLSEKQPNEYPAHMKIRKASKRKITK